jgi:hypothetical protein
MAAEKVLAAATESFRAGKKSGHDHGADAGSSATVDVIHLAAVRRRRHRLHGVKVRNTRAATEERRGRIWT